MKFTYMTKSKRQVLSTGKHGSMKILKHLQSISKNFWKMCIRDRYLRVHSMRRYDNYDYEEAFKKYIDDTEEERLEKLLDVYKRQGTG